MDDDDDACEYQYEEEEVQVEEEEEEEMVAAAVATPQSGKWKSDAANTGGRFGGNEEEEEEEEEQGLGGGMRGGRSVGISGKRGNRGEGEDEEDEGEDECRNNKKEFGDDGEGGEGDGSEGHGSNGAALCEERKIPAALLLSSSTSSSSSSSSSSGVMWVGSDTPPPMFKLNSPPPGPPKFFLGHSAQKPLRQRGNTGTLGSLGTRGEDGEYISLSSEELLLLQGRMVDEVASLLNISKDVTNVLLLHFKWNQERLMEMYYSNPEATLAAAGADQKFDVFQFDQSRFGEQVTCGITGDEILFEESFSMGCSTKEHPEEHRFSLDSWRYYLSSKLEQGFQCIFARCPMEGCNAIVSPSVWRTVFTCRSLADAPHVAQALVASTPSARKKPKTSPTLTSVSPSAASTASSFSEGADGFSFAMVAKTSPEHIQCLEKYESFINKSFVDLNSGMKWCPSPGCTFVIKATGSATEVRCCNCRARFCFRCHLEGHAPATCKTIKIWIDKCRNESETANWILANTKSCPKCGTRIEKNQGCNHMTCSRCRHEFCWICTKNWHDHGNYFSCNKYQGVPPKVTGEDEASKAKRELDRYLHYYKRYHGHEVSLKFAEKQRSDAEKKMEEMQNQGRWADVDYLAKAVEQLIECRRVLKYTYVHAFYLEEGKMKTLFEYNQMMLESNTEKLSELTERPIEKLSRREVMNVTAATNQFVRNLLNDVITSEFVDAGLDTSTTAPSTTTAVDASAASVAPPAPKASLLRQVRGRRQRKGKGQDGTKP